MVAVNKELLNTKVVREVIALVFSGEFAEGVRLPAERKLCERFGVSRGTIRQALADLESLGVIETKPGSGSYVRKFSIKKLPDEVLPPDFNSVSLKDILIARRAIETAAIELACEKITKKDYEDLEKLIDRMVESLDNLPDFIKFDMVFHRHLVRTSGNSALVTAFEAISEYHRYSQVFTSLHAGEEEIAIDYHRRMLYALRKRNKELAQKAISEHLDNMEVSTKRR